MLGFAAWAIDALLIGTGAGLLYWLLWGGGFPWVYAVLIGVVCATYWSWRRTPTPGRRLADRLA
jgi:hypothetical protein